MIWAVSLTAKSILQDSKKIEDELYSYDADYQKLMPLVNNNVNTFHYYLDSKLYAGQYVHFKTKNTVVVFVNNKLYKKYQNLNHVVISIDDIVKNNQGNKLLLTFYSPNKANLIIETIAIGTIVSAHEKNKNSFEIIDRLGFITSQSNIFAMLLLFILFFAIKRSLSPSFFKYVYNPLYLIKESDIEDSNNVSRIDLSKLIFVLFDCIIVVFIYTALRTERWDLTIYKNSFQTLGYIVLFLVSKYVFNQIVANIFKLSNVSNLQYFQMLRHIMIFALSILVLYLVFSSPFTYFSVSGHVIFNALILTLLFSYIVKVSFSLKKIINFRSIYFISYICITELIPMILFLVFYFSRINIGFV